MAERSRILGTATFVETDEIRDARDAELRGSGVPELRVRDLMRPTPSHAPPMVRRAVELIREHADDFIAEIAAPSFESLQARIDRDELVSLGLGVRDWAHACPEYLSAEQHHPLRRLIRAVERIDQALRNDGATSDFQSVDRVLGSASSEERARAAAAILATRKKG